MENFEARKQEQKKLVDNAPLSLAGIEGQKDSGLTKMVEEKNTTINDILARDDVRATIEEFTEDNMKDCDDLILIWITGNSIAVKTTADLVTSLGLIELAKGILDE